LTAPLRRGLVRAVVVQKPIIAGMGVLVGALTVWSTVGAQAPSGSTLAGAPADRVRQILQAVEADESAHELVSRALNQAHSTLDQAARDAAPERRAALEAMALEWAETARDLKRARDAEQASDRLEQSLSALQTELVRTRASVEQALARVGRARQELSELERSKGRATAPAGAPRQ
jgi:chromosome segregation ATPase